MAIDNRTGVPAYYCKPGALATLEWDDSPQAWAWKQVCDIRNEMLFEGAARTLATMGTIEQLPALMANAMWGDPDTLENFIREHEEDIERYAVSISRGGNA